MGGKNVSFGLNYLRLQKGFVAIAEFEGNPAGPEMLLTVSPCGANPAGLQSYTTLRLRGVVAVMRVVLYCAPLFEVLKQGRPWAPLGNILAEIKNFLALPYYFFGNGIPKFENARGIAPLL